MDHVVPRWLLVIILAQCALAAGCERLPRDPESTLQHVEGGRLRIGVVERPPWVVRNAEQPQGAEVELARRFASELGATPDWHWGSEGQHLQALEYYELDLVIGGITDETPWSKYVGLTGPYFEETLTVGVPAATPPPKQVEGMQVYARSGEPIMAYLKKKGAAPVAVEDLSQAGGAVAAPRWKIEQLGLVGTDVVLHTEKHVMAVPPGENGFLKRLEEFLHRQRPQVKNLLQQAYARS